MADHIIAGTRASLSDVQHAKARRGRGAKKGQGGGDKTPVKGGSRQSGHISDVDKKFGRSR